MQCPKCSKENPDDAQLCHSCSSVLTSTPAQAPALGVKTSGLATASFVLGILSFCTFFITSIPAIILGIVGLVKIRKSGGKLKGNGFAIAGIVMALTIPILMIPILMHVRQIAYRLVCGTNMSLIGMELLVYINDYDDSFPIPSEWCDLLIKHAKVKPSLVKPSTLRCFGATEGPCNFAMNKNIEQYGLRSSPDMVLLFETHPGWNQSGGPEILTTDNHKGEGCNVLFMDFHVDFVKKEDLDDLKWKPD
jgi:prepilin-type processing-associated H-X9-DG protein